jgi:hypothetical protein
VNLGAPVHMSMGGRLLGVAVLVMVLVQSCLLRLLLLLFLLMSPLPVPVLLAVHSVFSRLTQAMNPSMSANKKKFEIRPLVFPNRF